MITGVRSAGKGYKRGGSKSGKYSVYYLGKNCEEIARVKFSYDLEKSNFRLTSKNSFYECSLNVSSAYSLS